MILRVHGTQTSVWHNKAMNYALSEKWDDNECSSHKGEIVPAYCLDQSKINLPKWQKGNVRNRMREDEHLIRTKHV